MPSYAGWWSGVAWIRMPLSCDEHKELAKCGRAFVEALLRAGEQGAVSVLDLNGKPIPYEGACKVDKVHKPKTQYKKIDVYFQAEVDGKRITFVVEDKTDSREHSGQLDRYRKIVENDDEREDYFKLIYFKTGYVYPDEKVKIQNNNYSILDLKQLSEFLNDWKSCDNQILKEYREFIEKTLRKQKENIDRLDLKEQYVQYIFMSKFYEKLKKEQNLWKDNIPKEFEYNMKSLGYGMGIGGNPWVQIWFAKNLFWRIDPWSPIRLLLSNHITKEGFRNREEFQFYLDVFNVAFDIAGQEYSLEKISFRKTPYRNGKPCKECTIGAVNIPKNLGTESSVSLDEFLNRLVNLHVKFLEQVNKGWPVMKNA